MGRPLPSYPAEERCGAADAGAKGGPGCGATDRRTSREAEVQATASRDSMSRGTADVVALASATVTPGNRHAIGALRACSIQSQLMCAAKTR